MHTVYSVDLPDKSVLQFSIGSPNPDLTVLLDQFHAKSFAYITAYNPHSTTLTPEENQLRQQELLRVLQSRNYAFLTGQSIPEGGAWEPEQCAFVFDLPVNITRELCLLYQQDAAVIGYRGDIPKLLFTSDALRQDFVFLLNHCVLDA